MTAFQPGSPAYEALIAERNELRAESDISDGLIAAAKAEIERLTVQRNDAQNMTCHMAAEIEHLRTTLGYLADNIDNPALVAVAEAALKPKP